MFLKSFEVPQGSASDDICSDYFEMNLRSVGQEGLTLTKPF